MGRRGADPYGVRMMYVFVCMCIMGRRGRRPLRCDDNVCKTVGDDALGVPKRDCRNMREFLGIKHLNL